MSLQPPILLWLKPIGILEYQTVADEIYRLRDLKQNILAENAEREGKRQRIAENDRVPEQPGMRSGRVRRAVGT